MEAGYTGGKGKLELGFRHWGPPGFKEEGRASWRMGSAVSQLSCANRQALSWRRRPRCPTVEQGAREKGERVADLWARVRKRIG